MSPTPRDESGWTIETYSAHNEALRMADERFQAERDRRYAEVQRERERAVTIKEAADARALSLARDIQDYKDEKANELRSQIESERGTYLTREEFLVQHSALADKLEAALKPLAEYVSTARGRSAGIGVSAATLYAVALVVVAIISALILYTDAHPAHPPATTVTITTPR